MGVADSVGTEADQSEGVKIDTDMEKGEDLNLSVENNKKVEYETLAKAAEDEVPLNLDISEQLSSTVDMVEKEAEPVIKEIDATIAESLNDATLVTSNNANDAVSVNESITNPLISLD